VLVIVVTN